MNDWILKKSNENMLLDCIDHDPSTLPGPRRRKLREAGYLIQPSREGKRGSNKMEFSPEATRLAEKLKRERRRLQKDS